MDLIQQPCKMYSLSIPKLLFNVNLFFLFFCSETDPTEAAIEKRSLQRSIVQYSTFDWSTVPLSEEKRLAKGETKQPRILTVRFR